MSTRIFNLNGLRNPPPDVTPTNHPGSKLSKSGFRLLPSETVDFPKLVSARGGTRGRNILHPRVNINDEAFQSTLTHMNPDRISQPQDLNHPQLHDINSVRPIKMKRFKRAKAIKKKKKPIKKHGVPRKRRRG